MSKGEQKEQRRQRRKEARKAALNTLTIFNRVRAGQVVLEVLTREEVFKIIAYAGSAAARELGVDY